MVRYTVCGSFFHLATNKKRVFILPFPFLCLDSGVLSRLLSFFFFFFFFFLFSFNEMNPHAAYTMTGKTLPLFLLLSPFSFFNISPFNRTFDIYYISVCIYILLLFLFLFLRSLFCFPFSPGFATGRIHRISLVGVVSIAEIGRDVRRLQSFALASMERGGIKVDLSFLNFEHFDTKANGATCGNAFSER